MVVTTLFELIFDDDIVPPPSSSATKSILECTCLLFPINIDEIQVRCCVQRVHVLFEPLREVVGFVFPHFTYR